MEILGTGAIAPFQYDPPTGTPPTATPWSFTGSSGVSSNNSGFTSGNPNAPQGTQVAFLQQYGSISQSVPVATSGPYVLTFQAANRGNFGVAQENFEVLIDGSVVGIFTPSSTSYQSYSTVAFPVIAGTTPKITFQGLDSAGGDNTAFIDQVAVALASPSSIGDPGFEQVVVGSGQFQYGPTGSPWVFTGGSGISGNNSGFTSGNPNAPQGAQVAILQQTGSFSQSVTGLTAGSYVLTFDAAQRGNHGGSEDFNVQIDGSVVGIFTPSSTSYQSYSTVAFSVTGDSSTKHTITFQGLDRAGGDNTAFLDTTTLTMLQASTTTALTSDSNPSVSGQSVTFTATVAAVSPGSGTPTGTVTFDDGTTSIGTAATLTAGVATFTTSTLTASGSPYSITAVYSGDTNFTTSTSSAVSQVVNQASTTTALTSGTNPSVSGQSVTFTATVAAVSPGSGTPTGTVTFDDGTTPIGTVTLSSGVATFTTSSSDGRGSPYSITAVYSGDTNFTTSTSSAVSQVVNQASTTTALTSGTNPSVSGQSVTFTATVAAVSPGSGTPTGTVTFDDGTTTIGTGTLSSGVATFTTSSSDGQRQSVLDHRGLLRRHELHYQYLECRFPGCEPGEHDDRAASPPVPTPVSPVSR